MKLSIAFLIESVEFTPGVIAGTASLGGSESACLGLARALKARGHHVHIFATKIAAGVKNIDHAGVIWHRLEGLPLATLFYDWDVLVGLRMPTLMSLVPAKMKVLWNQDLLMTGQMHQTVMAHAWAYDKVAYVSAYHRQQWEAIAPELASLGYTTRNGFDPALVPTGATKSPRQILHISRPERGLQPLLQMWPALKALEPDAELALCRYSSMYDSEGWGKVCAHFDEMVAAVNAEVGGIRWLGELGKADLYRTIAESAVMWYPGVHDFAETSCIAAIEAQACGTPFVGSYKGALPETCPGGVFVKGDAESPEYQRESIAAVRYALKGCRDNTFGYRQAIQQGKQHVSRYTFAAIAAEWEAWLFESFAARYATQKPHVLSRLLYEDDHVMGREVAVELGDVEAIALCDRVGAGKEWTATQYAETAMDPIEEIESDGMRAKAVVSRLAGKTRILDIACGNGSFAITLARADAARHVTAIDYSDANIAAGRKAAEHYGVAHQITFIAAPVWDFDRQAPDAAFEEWMDEHAGVFDGVFCGEFIEHIEEATGLVDFVERAVAPGGRLIWTCPYGPMSQLTPRQRPMARGHVHHFRAADIQAVFGQKAEIEVAVLPWGPLTPRNERVGNWSITYTKTGAKTGTRDLSRRMLIRPMPTLSVGIITDNTLDLRRCLDAVWPIADEIILGDCGADPIDLARICEEFPRKTRVIPVGHVPNLRGGFSEARNTVLQAATGGWFMWIDCDETLCGAEQLAKYLEGPLFNGYVIDQNHFHLDNPMTSDKPVRVFRRRPDIQFYGCVHEQPQMGDCNGEVVPALQTGDVQIAHTGYLHEGIRRGKALHRNLPLLVRDREVFPDRELGRLLVLRDYGNLAYWAREQSGGVLTEDVKRYEQAIIGMFEAHFMDPSHKYHVLARPYYFSALRDVEGAMEVEIGASVGVGGLGRGTVKTERVWVRTPEHLRRLLASRVDALLQPIERPVQTDVEPVGSTETYVAPFGDTESAIVGPPPTSALMSEAVSA